jgi:cytochrome oxidase Cu insertion factor (SCO1/SenC/PrrC family)
MQAMRPILLLLFTLIAAPAFSQNPQPTEAEFRKRLGIGPTVRMEYRDTACKPVDFGGFVVAMGKPGAGANVDRAVDGTAVTMSVKLRGMAPCPSPYPEVTEMPPFDLEDLDGKRVSSKSLKGKPTLISFFFSTCIPCILEVEPLNRYAESQPQMNYLAVTFDDPAEARAFVKRFGVRWRVVPDAQDFIERMRVKQYPLMALFDANGKLLGTMKGGAKDELEAANVEPRLRRWVNGLLY